MWPWGPNRPTGKKNGYGPEARNHLIQHVFFGVADGARTHDNRNHNPNRKTLQLNDFIKFSGEFFGILNLLKPA
jgi:hypothetical protein